MNFVLKMLAGVLLKGLGPINGGKSLIGIVLGIAVNVARYYELDIPAIDSSVLDLIYTSLTAFGLGHKGGKSAAA